MAYFVLALDGVDKSAIELLQNTDGISVQSYGKLTREETLMLLPEANGIIIRSATKADAELLAAAPNLKIIARAGVGVDNVDLDAATERGIIVANTPGGNTIATAEHAFGLMLALARHIPQAQQSMVEGRWDRKAFMGTELRGKTLGIIGFGRIGRALAQRAQAFEMNVIATDPFVPAEVGTNLGVALVDLDSLYAQADYISLHSLITDETRGMINRRSLSMMKPGVRIINAARGALIVEEDLAEGIKSGKVAGAAIDVYDPEPPLAGNPLVDLPGVVHTPHLAASTAEAQVAVAVEAAELIIDALLNGSYQNVCNPAVLQTA